MKHYVTSTLHITMCNTLQSMANEIYQSNKYIKMWDKGHMIVILSWKKLAKNTIFVGHKNDTVDSMKHSLTR